MKFRYQAKTKKGELQTGLIEANNKEAALSILEGHELYVLSLEKVGESFIQRFKKIFVKVKREDLTIFCRQFAVLLSAEVNLIDSLKTLFEQTDNIFLKEAIGSMVSDIESGLSLSQALEKQSGVFSSFFVNMVRSGEVTGRVGEVMEYLADYYEKENNLFNKVKGALTYPIIVLLVFGVVVAILLTAVFPQLEPIFAEAKVELPFFTKILISSGDFFSQWWWVILSAIALFIILLIDYSKSKEGKVVFDELLLKLPGIGKLFIKLYVARFAESCAVLIKGGIPIPQAIEISAITIDNVVYKDLLKKASVEVRKGDLVSNILRKEPRYFPPLVYRLISVGESTGRLDEMLSKLSDFLSRDVDNMVSNLVELIQPTMIVFIGVLIGILFASVLLPIYNLALTF